MRPYYATASTGVTKLGAIPTIYVGATLDDSRESCRKAGCRLLKGIRDPETGLLKKCYSQFGQVAKGHIVLQKAEARNPGRYSLDYALRARRADARVVRMGMNGNPSTGWSLKQGKAIVGKILLEGLKPISYDHAWRQLKGEAKRFWSKWSMASCESESDADRAISEGWRASLVGEHRKYGLKDGRAIIQGPHTWETEGGNTAQVCPAVVKPVKVMLRGPDGIRRDYGHGIKGHDCNNCGLCVASEPGPIVVFPDHGAGVRHLTTTLETK
jgi:hypothetical protein